MRNPIDFTPRSHYAEIDRQAAHDRARWEYLFHPDRNRWKPSK